MKAALLLLLLPLVADEPMVAPMQCRNGVCLMPEGFARALIEAHNELVEEIRALKAKEKEPPKCAKTEITEPSKNYPMTPEPKKAPEFKLERNT